MRGVANAAMTATIAAATRAICDVPPDASLSAVRELLADTGNACENPAAMLEAPRPASSRFASTS
jgi:hypothetical protein